MARLKIQSKAETSGKPPFLWDRLCEQRAESIITTVIGDGQKAKRLPIGTSARTEMFEDGSGRLILKRGPDDIVIHWTEEGDGIEIHANFSGVEGVLKATEEPVSVPEGNDGN